MSEENIKLMYDLAAKVRKTVNVDLLEYIMKNEIVCTALRIAKKNKTPDENGESL